MQILAVQQILGLLLVLFSTTLLPPVFVSWWYEDHTMRPFLLAYGIILAAGLVTWLPVCRRRFDLRVREGFVVVVMFWLVLAAVGALPLALAEHPHMRPVDAFFESVSGLTTTGATVLTGIDDLPRSILYYRQQMQWLGGMGIVVLAVAIMPMLGVGGMQLYRAETPGPMKDNKLTPRITETAKALWYIYLGMTVACVAAYWLAGMDLFDAIGHGFATVSTGGFSTHDRSLAYFDNFTIDGIAVIFMFLGAINYALHFTAWRFRRPVLYLKDAEWRFFVTVLFVLSAVVAVMLSFHSGFERSVDALRYGVFQVMSIVTSTGFTTTDFSVWPSFLPVLLILASCLGGCAGSTSGGIKIIRVALLYKQGKREMLRLVHPNALMPVKLGGRPVPDSVIDAVWGFLSLYVTTLVVLSLAMIATGLDWVSAFAAVTACLNNLGPGLGTVAANYAAVPDAGKWILSLAMLLGRLELFTLLVLFLPAFWRS